ncbi:hypothetical protein PIB30_109563, partial [Stylosanthes scabra]|nr:hypothetical protein [Stylosanthes scabra]
QKKERKHFSIQKKESLVPPPQISRNPRPSSLLRRWSSSSLGSSRRRLVPRLCSGAGARLHWARRGGASSSTPPPSSGRRIQPHQPFLPCSLSAAASTTNPSSFDEPSLSHHIPSQRQPSLVPSSAFPLSAFSSAFLTRPSNSCSSESHCQFLSNLCSSAPPSIARSFFCTDLVSLVTL